MGGENGRGKRSCLVYAVLFPGARDLFAVLCEQPSIVSEKTTVYWISNNVSIYDNSVNTFSTII